MVVGMSSKTGIRRLMMKVSMGDQWIVYQGLWMLKMWT